MLVIKKPATKERKGINPFTKVPTVFKGQASSQGHQGTPGKGGQGRGSVAKLFRETPDRSHP
jgi:hypothetical protein